MNIKEVFFPLGVPMPGSFSYEKQIKVRPDWVASIEAYGVKIAVPGKGIYLYPWTTISRIECFEDGVKAAVDDEPRRGPGRPRKDAA